MHTDLIQTSCLVLGREIPLSASDSTLGKPPHRDTLLEKAHQEFGKKDVKAQGLKKYLISIELMDEIPSGDRWSLMTIRSEEETGGLSASTLNRC
jgi:hypothetical protein